MFDEEAFLSVLLLRHNRSLPTSVFYAFVAACASYGDRDDPSLHGRIPPAAMQSQKEASTFVALLKACAKKKDLSRGALLHRSILMRERLLQDNPVLSTSLINMYAKCGSLANARKVMEELPRHDRDVYSWSSLISGYAQQGLPYAALECSDQMLSEGIQFNEFTLSCLLNVCGSVTDVKKGMRIHGEIIGRGLLEETGDVVLGNALVDMYAKCGELLNAESVLQVLPVRNAVSWSALITGYAQKGKFDIALNCYGQMRGEGIIPDSVAFICILKACGSTGSLDKGKQIHDEIIHRGLLHTDVVLGTALVDMYAKCGALTRAYDVLKGLPIRNVVTWNALIAGYAQQAQCPKALDLLKQMQNDGIAPDCVTFVNLLKACGSTGAIDDGKRIHEEIVGWGFLEKNNVVLGNALVDMYVKCGLLVKARQVLEELQSRDVISWNALLTGYALEGQDDEAFACFLKMQSEGVSPNAVTFISVLKACGSSGAIEKGSRIHDDILKSGLLQTDIMVGNALVDMYVKCGMLSKAQRVLKELPVRDVISWNALIGGYGQEGRGHEALNSYEKMLNEGIFPDTITFICILKACATSGAISKGIQIHEEICNRGLLENDVILGTALVDMYAKCGMLAKAHQVLKELPVRNVFSWSALIAGYAARGQSHEALGCFKQMQTEGLTPNEVTFLSVLNACQHSGLLNDARSIFHDMVVVYRVMPKLEHHTCMVVVFGSAGHFDEAIAVIKVMPSPDHVEIWLAMLCACRRWGHVKLGILSFDQIIQIDNSCASAYVIVGGIFAASGMREDAEKAEAMRCKYGGN